ncbi:MAG: hypothetical protein HC817_16200 [Saprospiraceae bacterium]|nr:hypothetical protein [Saprospiraceae bacterium]
MEKIGQIEIKIKGRKGNLDLRPDNYDIKEVMEVLRNAENLLFPSSKKDSSCIFQQI